MADSEDACEASGSSLKPLSPASIQGELSGSEEEEPPNFFQEAGGACFGSLVGLALVVCSLPFLWWNEQRYISTWRVLDEASRLVVDAPCNAALEDNYGRLLHVTCGLQTEGGPPIDTIGVEAPAGKALLERGRSMLQWEEDEEKDERRDADWHRKIVRRFRYRQVWSSERIDSSLFRHPDSCMHGGSLVPCRNPPWPADLQGGSKFWADTVKAGAFRLPAQLREKIPADEPFPPPLGTYHGSEGRVYRRDPSGLSTVEPGRPPAVGDIRLEYTVNGADAVSVLGAQVYSPAGGATFGSFTTPKGRVFRPELVAGERDAAEMFQSLLQSNEWMLWLLRAGGWIACWVGIAMAFGPVQQALSWVPLIGGVLSGIASTAVAVAAGAVSLAASAVVVAAAWLFYRPLISVPLLCGAAALLAWASLRRRRAEQQAAAEAPPSPAGSYQPLPHEPPAGGYPSPAGWPPGGYGGWPPVPLHPPGSGLAEPGSESPAAAGPYGWARPVGSESPSAPPAPAFAWERGAAAPQRPPAV